MPDGPSTSRTGRARPRSLLTGAVGRVVGFQGAGVGRFQPGVAVPLAQRASLFVRGNHAASRQIVIHRPEPAIARLAAGRLRGVLGDPFPALRRREGAGHDAVDVPDRLRRQRPAHTRFASHAPAVMLAAARRAARRRSEPASSATITVRPWRTMISPSSARAAKACCSVAVGTSCRAHHADRGERLASGEHPGADRGPDRVRLLLPGGLTAGGIDGKDRHVPVLGERLPGAPGIPAAPQLRVQEVEQGAAYLADLQVPESGLDHPPDVELVRLPGRQVPAGDLRIPVHELGHGGVRLGLASRRGLLKQLAELDLRRPFGLTGLP